MAARPRIIGALSALVLVSACSPSKPPLAAAQTVAAHDYSQSLARGNATLHKAGCSSKVVLCAPLYAHISPHSTIWWCWKWVKCLRSIVTSGRHAPLLFGASPVPNICLFPQFWTRLIPGFSSGDFRF